MRVVRLCVLFCVPASAVMASQSSGSAATTIKGRTTNLAPPDQAGGGLQSEEGGSAPDSEPDLTQSDIVAYSSRLIAAARALESRRRDRLFGDPYAELLAGPDAMKIAEDRQNAKEQEEEKAAAAAIASKASKAGTTTLTTATTASSSSSSAAAAGAATPPTAKTAVEGDSSGGQRRLAIRTRFCDDFFEDCASRRGIKQIVSLGAGMDTRGLRLKASEGTKVFEVDQALVLRVKNALLVEAAAADEVAASVSGFRERRDGGVGQARVIPVEADLSVQGWPGELFEAGFDASQPSAWILEGLTMYLTEHEVVSLIRVLANLCSPGSAFLATTVSADSVVRAQASESPLFGTWKWGSDDPQAFFEGKFPTGWTFKGVRCGTPGGFPDGADYGVGFQGKAPAYVTGYYSASAPAVAADNDDPSTGAKTDEL